MRMLSKQILSSLTPPVQVPAYDSSKLIAGVLHIGVGNFHRAHMAAYFDDLFHQTDQFEINKHWGIVGSGILSFDADKRTQLESQDWLQTLVERDEDSVKPRILGSMIDFLPVDYEANKHEALQETLVNPNIKIVSLTVTEGGYFLSDGAFDPNHPQIKHDIEHPNTPQSIFGMIVRALDQRKQTGQLPFTVMSCDNIPHNGNVVRSVVVGLAAEINPELSSWIDENVAFPNSMVDRITPGTTNDQRQFIKDQYGYEDAAPIFCEPFRQWVLEDKFSQGRPNLESLENVKFVPDVTPYEFMKIRILNGGHATLCYPSALLGVQYVHDAMQHPTIAPFLDALERNEIIPSVPPVPDNTSLTEYWTLIAKRFSNPTIGDTIGRNCFDGASRQPKFIIPVAADNLKAGRQVDGLALVSAMWCRYCQGKTEAGEDIPPNDPQWDRLQANAKEAAAGNPTKWLDMTDVYGNDVGKNPHFIECFASALQTIQKDGVEAAMKQYVEASKVKTLA